MQNTMQNTTELTTDLFDFKFVQNKVEHIQNLLETLQDKTKISAIDFVFNDLPENTEKEISENEDSELIPKILKDFIDKVNDIYGFCNENIMDLDFYFDQFNQFVNESLEEQQLKALAEKHGYKLVKA